MGINIHHKGIQIIIIFPFLWHNYVLSWVLSWAMSILTKKAPLEDTPLSDQNTEYSKANNNSCKTVDKEMYETF